MSDPELLRLPAIDLAARVRAGELSPVEVVEAHIRRIERVNPLVNGLVCNRYEAAREEARAAEREAATGASTRPLLGVPFTVKEMIELEGMPHTFGSAGRRGRRASGDATVVARLRAAGAIALGVTNVPEWGMWYETYNDIYGMTRNPYDVRRTAGGSSGGEGAIVGAGGSVFGLGSDIGGSVRMPAAFCGVFGHKPTHGLLPLTGLYPVYAAGPDAAAHRRAPCLTVGTLTRSALDIELLLRVMSGPDGVDPQAESLSIQSSAAVSWQGRRVVLLEQPDIALARAPSADARAAVQRAGAALAQRGAAISYAPRNLLQHAGDMWFAALQSAGGPSFSELLGGGRRIALMRELTRTSMRRGTYSWPALLFCIGEKIGRRSDRHVQRALQATDRLHARLHELLGGEGVLILPVHPRVAPRHYAAVLRPFDFLYTAVFNALRVPATAVPMGFDAAGLPLAVQAVSTRGNDHVTIAAAIALADQR
ncbi:MAG TPA: amidase [Longimicrobiales bacterium]|nr:amidase [Longimicrobiales bacterium]